MLGRAPLAMAMLRSLLESLRIADIQVKMLEVMPGLVEPPRGRKTDLVSQLLAFIRESDADHDHRCAAVLQSFTVAKLKATLEEHGIQTSLRIRSEVVWLFACYSRPSQTTFFEPPPPEPPPPASQIASLDLKTSKRCRRFWIRCAKKRVRKDRSRQLKSALTILLKDKLNKRLTTHEFILKVEEHLGWSLDTKSAQLFFRSKLQEHMQRRRRRGKKKQITIATSPSLLEEHRERTAMHYEDMLACGLRMETC